MYNCDKCGYETNIKQCYNNHLKSKKHCNTVVFKFKCNCNKGFQSLNGLSRHKKNCSKINNTEEPQPSQISNLSKDELLTTIKNMEQNQKTIEENQKRMENLIIELMKKEKPTPLTAIQNNNTNNFDIKIFLNENCKDAINIMDFAKSITDKLLDFVNINTIPEVGYINMMTDLITKTLKSYHVLERPLHNIEDEEMYYFVKHNNKWKKEYTCESNILSKAMDTIDSNVFFKITDELNTDPNLKEILKKQSVKDNRNEVMYNVLDNILIFNFDAKEYFELEN